MKSQELGSETIALKPFHPVIPPWDWGLWSRSLAWAMAFSLGLKKEAANGKEGKKSKIAIPMIRVGIASI